MGPVRSRSAASILQVLAESPIIPAVWRDDTLAAALETPCRLIHLAGGRLSELSGWVDAIHQQGGFALVHLEMFAGLGKDAEAAAFVVERFGADGIVSASPGAIQRAMNLGCWGVLRVFVHDSQSMESGRQLMVKATPSAVELMPGLVVGQVLSSFAPPGSPPVIAAGLIKTPEQAAELLAQGVAGIDTSAARLWRWSRRSSQIGRSSTLATVEAISRR